VAAACEQSGRGRQHRPSTTQTRKESHINIVAPRRAFESPSFSNRSLCKEMVFLLAASVIVRPNVMPQAWRAQCAPIPRLQSGLS
jgi:hypothetical protein